MTIQQDTPDELPVKPTEPIPADKAAIPAEEPAPVEKPGYENSLHALLTKDPPEPGVSNK